MLLKHYLLKAGILSDRFIDLKEPYRPIRHSLHSWIKRKSFKQKQEPNSEAWLILNVFIPVSYAWEVAKAHVWMNWLSHHCLLISHNTPACSCIIKKIYHYSMLPKPLSFGALYLKEEEISKLRRQLGKSFFFVHFFGLKHCFSNSLNLRPQ